MIWGPRAGVSCWAASKTGVFPCRNSIDFPNTPVKVKRRLVLGHRFTVLRVEIRPEEGRATPVGFFRDQLLIPGALITCCWMNRGRNYAPTYHYRDPLRNRGKESALPSGCGKRSIAETGIQFMVINTLYQLGAESPERLESRPSTSGHWRRLQLLAVGGGAWPRTRWQAPLQLYNPRTRNWSRSLARRPAIATARFSLKLSCRARRWPRWKGIMEGGGPERRPRLCASCSHDTGAAVAAVPAQEKTGLISARAHGL